MSILQLSRLLFTLILFTIHPMALLMAGVTKQMTVNQAVGPTDRSEEGDRPDSPGICVRYTLCVDSDTGELKLKAKFTNKDKDKAKRFVFCQMVGTSRKTVEKNADCDLIFDGNTLKCKKTDREFDSFNDNYHFGCLEVSLAGGETKTKDYGTSGAQAKFKGKEAKDFFVTYADYVELPTGFSFDSSDCKACFGLNKTTGLNASGGRPDLLGDWYLPILPVTDPFILYQPIIPERVFLPEYKSFTQPFSLPSDMPVEVPGVPHNVPGPIPESYNVPLNLFDVYTMNAPPEEVFPSQITILASGSERVTFTTDPAPGEVFTMPGRGELMGTITITAGVEVEEGEQASVEVVVHVPDEEGEPGNAYFTQKGTFVQDTQPPEVLDHEVNLTERTIEVTTTARDETTMPLSADFWYSADGGATWISRELVADDDPFDEAKQRTFAASLPLSSLTPTISYFITVQDQVMNQTFFGVGAATAVWDYVWSVDEVDWGPGIWTKDGRPIGATFPDRVTTGGNQPNHKSDHITMPEEPNDWHWDVSYQDSGEAKGLSVWFEEFVPPDALALEIYDHPDIASYVLQVNIGQNRYMLKETEDGPPFHEAAWSGYPLNLPQGFKSSGLMRGNISDVPAQKLLYTWISNNDLFGSTVVVNNPYNHMEAFTLTGTRGNGDRETRLISIPAHGFLEIAAEELFPVLGKGSGYSVVLAAHRMGFAGRWTTQPRAAVSSGSPSQGVALELPVESSACATKAATRLLFGYLPNDDLFISALVLVNVGIQTTEVSFLGYDEKGNLQATAPSTITLEPDRPLAILTRNLFPGYDGSLQVTASSTGEQMAGTVFVFDRNDGTAIGTATPDVGH